MFANTVRKVVCLSLALTASCTDGDNLYADDPDGGPDARNDAGVEAGDGSGPAVVCPDPAEPIDPTALIDDLEDQDPTLLPIGHRSGGWWTAGDDTPGATIVPDREGPAYPELIPGGRCGSRYAMRVTGQGFSEWGAILGISLAYGSAGALFYDASFRDGVTFWARIGDTSSNRMRLSISDVNSEPAGGRCEVDGPPGTGCYDAFSVMISNLDTTWKRYKIPFGGLTQRDFGLPAEALDTTQIYTIGFNFEQGTVFDFWVDDIAFY
jgi:hypothetical protein